MTVENDPRQTERELNEKLKKNAEHDGNLRKVIIELPGDQMEVLGMIRDMYGDSSIKETIEILTQESIQIFCRMMAIKSIVNLVDDITSEENEK